MTTNTVTTTTTDISLAKLIPCPGNLRRTGAGPGIEALAASIQAHGLLQSLVVRPKLDGEGLASNRYEVVAGGRRLAALKLLAKQKRIAKGTATPCRVLDADEVDVSEASLAENIVRQDMTSPTSSGHSTGCTRAASALRTSQPGSGSPPYRAAADSVGLRLPCPNPSLQRRGTHSPPPDRFRGVGRPSGTGLSDRAVADLAAPPRHHPAAADARPDSGNRPQALFVGLDAYTTAGGTVQCDLFSEDRGGWIADATLLGRLVAE